MKENCAWPDRLCYSSIVTVYCQHSLPYIYKNTYVNLSWGETSPESTPGADHNGCPQVWPGEPLNLVRVTYGSVGGLQAEETCPLLATVNCLLHQDGVGHCGPLLTFHDGKWAGLICAGLLSGTRKARQWVPGPEDSVCASTVRVEQPVSV